MMTVITSALKQLLKEELFMQVAEVEQACHVAAYIAPIQQFLNHIAANQTVYQVNAAMEFIRKHFSKHSSAHWEARGEEAILHMGTSLHLHVLPGHIAAYEDVVSPYTSSGVARARKTL